MTPKISRRVALIVEISNGYARGILGGIVGYMREHQPWAIDFSEHSRGASPPSWVRRWKGDGIIARVENETIARVVTRLGVPLVDVSSARMVPSIPFVKTDDAAIADAAFKHLWERGFRSFGYCGQAGYRWSATRHQRFRSLCQETGCACSSHGIRRGRHTVSMESEMESISKWITGLPRPLRIMASYDFRGRQVLEACRQRGFRVPDDVAVIGVDNDETLCQLSNPPLTSVILNPYRTGYDAAMLLDRMMNGEEVPPTGHFIEPLGVATRQSTDTLAINDPRIVEVLRYIREQACRGINVKDVLRAMPQSRRQLEGRFRKLVGRTIHDEISRVQLDRVKVLLVDSNLSLERIAELTGFTHVEYLSVVFRKKMGLPPSQYRMLNRVPFHLRSNPTRKKA